MEICVTNFLVVTQSVSYANGKFLLERWVHVVEVFFEALGKVVSLRNVRGTKQVNWFHQKKY